MLTILPSGPPSIPQVYSIDTNNSICYDAYSNPNYPIEKFILNITQTDTQYNNMLSTKQEVFNSSGCIMLNISNCTLIQLSVQASNELGLSTISEFSFNNYSLGNSVCEITYKVIELSFTANLLCQETPQTKWGRSNFVL